MLYCIPIRSLDRLMSSSVDAPKTLYTAFCLVGVYMDVERLSDDSGDLCFEQNMNTTYSVYGV